MVTEGRFLKLKFAEFFSQRTPPFAQIGQFLGSSVRSSIPRVAALNFGG